MSRNTGLITAIALIALVAVGVVGSNMREKGIVKREIIAEIYWQDVDEGLFDKNDFTIELAGSGEIVPVQEEQGMDELWCFYFDIPLSNDETIDKTSAFAYRKGTEWQIVPVHEDDWLKHSCSKEYHINNTLAAYLMEIE